ncbi:MAG: DUF1707 domain-containing protein [Solirubrobacterales bacterium]|nr:DUF1707 domain-containing protein [Solirubrobacterales bacterium]
MPADAPRDPDLRASDEQRERAAQEIREHYAAGRLSEEELSERVQAAYSARTEHELTELLSDLPKLPATPAEQKAEIGARRRQLQRRLLQETGGGAALFLLCTVIWLVSGAHGQFWPIWVALVTLIPLVRNGWRLYGPAPEFDRVERELEARRRRDEHRKRLRSETRADAIDERRAARYERRRRER